MSKNYTAIHEIIYTDGLGSPAKVIANTALSEDAIKALNGKKDDKGDTELDRLVKRGAVRDDTLYDAKQEAKAVRKAGTKVDASGIGHAVGKVDAKASKDDGFDSPKK